MVDEVQREYQELTKQGSGWYEIQLPLIHETAKGLCFDADRTWNSNTQKPVWMPKSKMKILDLRHTGSGFRYFVPYWLYKKLK